MMILSIILLIISFLLQGLVSNFIGVNSSIFYTIYVLISLLIIYPHFENKKKYLILLFIFGLLMDLVYTNTTLLNVSLFFIIYYFSRMFHFFLPYNLLTINISNVLSVFIYNIITFLMLVILRVDSYSFISLIKLLGSSILMSIIFTSIVYWLVNYLKKRLDLKEVK